MLLPKEKLFGELLVNGGLIAVGEHLPRQTIALLFLDRRGRVVFVISIKNGRGHSKKNSIKSIETARNTEIVWVVYFSGEILSFLSSL